MTPVTNTSAQLAYAAANILGEGPVWHSGRKSFFWVDIEAKELQEIKWPSREVKVWDMPKRISAIVTYGENCLLVALQGGLAVFDIEPGQLNWFVDLEKDIVGNRPNDGKCDSSGRFWVGTMDVGAKNYSGSLYSIDQDKTITKHLSSLSISNGLAWSHDDKCFYFIDSSLYRVDRYFFNPGKGKLEFDSTAVRIPQESGMPDGMTIDEEGMLWVAHWDGFCVCRWDPNTGEMLDKIAVPAPQVTSCTFGGENLDVLLITTARVGLREETLLQYPQSGHLFFATPGVKGVPANKFRD